MKIAFVTDSGSGLSASWWKSRGIFSLPLQITAGGTSYDEGETISYQQVIDRLHNEEVMKTSMPAYGKIVALFEQIKEEGYEAIFAVPICKGLSGTLDAMESAATDLGLQFYGFDCYATAVVQSHCILTAKQMYDEGKSIDEILERLSGIADSCDTILLVNDLQNMKRGGRLTPIAAALGGLLKIKPILHDNKETDGRVDVLEKVRTMSKAQDKVIERMKNIGVQPDYDFTVAHVDAREPAEAYAKKISDAFGGAAIRIIDLVSAVGVHTGLGCLAVQVFDPKGHTVHLLEEDFAK